MSIKEAKSSLAPVITVHETDGAEFQKACAKAVANGYVLSSSHCGFVDSADYDYCNSWMAIFIRSESKPESKPKPGPRPEAKPADDAPEGATHYRNEGGEIFYHNVESGILRCWIHEYGYWAVVNDPAKLEMWSKQLTPIT